LFDDILARGPGQPDVLFTAAVLALEIESVDKARDYLTQLRATGARANDSAFLLGQTEELAGNKPGDGLVRQGQRRECNQCAGAHRRHSR
jgi:hypothetical protein